MKGRRVRLGCEGRKKGKEDDRAKNQNKDGSSTHRRCRVRVGKRLRWFQRDPSSRLLFRRGILHRSWGEKNEEREQDASSLSVLGTFRSSSLPPSGRGYFRTHPRFSLMLMHSKALLVESGQACSPIGQIRPPTKGEGSRTFLFLL